MHSAPTRRLRRVPGADELAAIARMWRGVWLIVSAHGRDALTDEVLRMGVALREAIDHRDRAAAFEVIERMHQWLERLAGMLVARVTAPFLRASVSGFWNLI